MIVLGFGHREFHGEIIVEPQRLHDDETVRVIDALAVYKDADGAIEVQHLSNLTREGMSSRRSRMTRLRR